MKSGTGIALVAACAMLAACASRPPAPAPVTERPPAPKPAPAPPAATAKPAPVATAKPAPAAPEARGEFYIVRPGDTLFGIAQAHKVDLRELAAWNGIDTRSSVKTGQQLRVVAPSGSAVAAPFKSAPSAVQAQPLVGSPVAPPSAPAAAGGKVLTEPRGVRVPYSEQALAQLSAPPAAPVAGRAEPPRPAPGGEAARGPDDLDWLWPVRGKIVATFNDTTSKGIAIAGKLGQPVLASAPGRVIFSGTGIRGFGKLVVIKHNDTYLSVYAHNSELVVKEGQSVTKGQKIAEMGNTDTDQVKLHFEIRRFGKPIDPIKLLPSPA